DVTLAIDPLWTEASALGLIGQDAVSSLGRALLAGDGLSLVANSFAHESTSEAIFQADLTVVVPGTPDPALAHLLDTVADRESRGSAGTWRLTSQSVRRALDAGHTADELIASLRRIAVGDSLPQPLEYLIADVARRHGTLRVRAVGCILRADDPALLAELTSTRSLGALQLSAVAPTVLASSLPLDRTLAALRAAGFAPVGESADGVPQIERRASRRAAKRAAVLPFNAGRVVRQLRSQPDEDDDFPLDYDDHTDETEPDVGPVERQQIAASLLTPKKRHLNAVPEREDDHRLPDAPVRIPTLRVVQRSAIHLDRDEQHVLAQAIDHNREIRIEYVSNEGKTTNRIIQPLELDGSRVIAWCHLRDDERAFSLGGITSVRPA
ncbi:MAG TPA: helicase C-terminal domain-containing protein, partial [Micromonosporaceae bacterium]